MDNYSLRSKLLQVQSVQKKIQTMMTTQEQILDDEQKQVDTFNDSSQDLFESKLVAFIQNIRRKKSLEYSKVKTVRAWKFSMVHVKALRRQQDLSKSAYKMKENATLF